MLEPRQRLAEQHPPHGPGTEPSPKPKGGELPADGLDEISKRTRECEADFYAQGLPWYLPYHGAMMPW